MLWSRPISARNQRYIMRGITSTFPSIVFLSSCVRALQFQQPFTNNCKEQIKPHRVAIIGAGAGGSSTAYHLSKYANTSLSNIPIEITIFENNSRVGGRTTTVNALNDPRYPTEVGASIFVKVNHILYNASHKFGLESRGHMYQSTGSAYEMGVWDGKQFVFTVANNDDNNGGVKGRLGDWWDLAKLLWKYGFSPIRTNQLMKSTIGKFLKLYDEAFPFNDLTSATKVIGLSDFTGVVGKEVLNREGISDEFAREVIQASTRVNYAQNLGNIHGLETMVCMAANGAMAIEGGNWQIFDAMVRQSNAKLELNTSVSAIYRTNKDTFIIRTASTVPKTGNKDKGHEFDTVVLAAPYQFANVTFAPKLEAIPPKVDYVSLYVTLFTSPYRPKASFFGLDAQSEVPDTILTTLPVDSRVSESDRGKNAVGPMQFWSLSTLNVLNPDTDTVDNNAYDEPGIKLQQRSKSANSVSGTHYLYKIFSPEPLDTKFLSKLFDFPATDMQEDMENQQQQNTKRPISSLPQSLVSWSYEKKWHSYPYLPPKTTFAPFKLDRNVWYTSAIEEFISTMETSALAGMNVAMLLYNDIELQKSKDRLFL